MERVPERERNNGKEKQGRLSIPMSFRGAKATRNPGFRCGRPEPRSLAPLGRTISAVIEPDATFGSCLHRALSASHANSANGARTGRFLRQHGKRKPQCHAPSPVLDICQQSPKSECGRCQIQVSERALREENRVKSGADDGCDRDFRIRNSLLPVGTVRAEQMRQLPAWPCA